MSEWLVRSEYRSILIADIEAYGAEERDDAIRSRLRASLRALIHEALDRAGIEPCQSTSQTTGDGLLVTIDPAIGKPRILRQVVASLWLGLQEHNRSSVAAERLRIRAVLHAADLLVDCDGPLGDQLNLAFRLLDAAELGELLQQAGGPMVLCVSNAVYQQVIAQRHEQLDPSNFEPIWLESKGVRQLGWVCAPGEPSLVARTRAVARSQSPDGVEASSMLNE
jgi:class 3 adenylate cyclase